MRRLALFAMLLLASVPSANAMCSGSVFVDCKGWLATVGVPFTVEHIAGFAFLNIPNATLKNGTLAAPPRSPGAVDVELNLPDGNATTVILNASSAAMDWNATLNIPMPSGAYRETDMNFTTPGSGAVDATITASSGADSKTMYLQFSVQAYPSIDWVPLALAGAVGVFAGALFQRKRT